jgi:hypothetical protein
MFFTTNQLGMGAYVCHPSYGGKHKIGKLDCIQISLGKKQYFFSKITRPKRAGGVTHLVDHLPSKHETLSSNSSSGKKKKEIQLLRFTLLYISYRTEHKTFYLIRT